MKPFSLIITIIIIYCDFRFIGKSNKLCLNNKHFGGMIGTSSLSSFNQLLPKLILEAN